MRQPRRTEPRPPPGRVRSPAKAKSLISAPVAEVWRRLIDPDELAAIVPGCRSLTQDGPDRYSAQVVIGVAGIRGTYDAEIEMRDKREGQSVRLVGKATGASGFGAGTGFVTLAAASRRAHAS